MAMCYFDKLRLHVKFDDPKTTLNEKIKGMRKKTEREKELIMPLIGATTFCLQRPRAQHLQEVLSKSSFFLLEIDC